MHIPCPACGCDGDPGTHAIVAALYEFDLDRAIDLGLLGDRTCPRCSADCRYAVQAARAARLDALAARERHRARERRLQLHAQERAARRDAAARHPSALPPSAAAALARARARAAKP